jgi:hypothetical protein
MARKMIEPDEQDISAQSSVELSRMTNSEHQEVIETARMFGIDGNQVCSFIDCARQNEDGTWSAPEGREFDPRVEEFGDVLLQYAHRTTVDGALDLDINSAIPSVVEEYIIPLEVASADNTRAVRVEGEGAGQSGSYQMMPKPNDQIPINISEQTEERIRAESERLGLNWIDVINLYRTSRIVSELNDRGANIDIQTQMRNRQGVFLSYGEEEIELAMEFSRNTRLAEDETMHFGSSSAEHYIEERDFRDIAQRHEREERRQQMAAARQEGQIPERDDFEPNSAGEYVWDSIRAEGRSPAQIIDLMQRIASGQVPDDPEEYMQQHGSQQRRDFEIAMDMIDMIEDVYDVNQFSNGRQSLVSLVTGSRQGVTDTDRLRYRMEDHRLIARLEREGSRET